jgi:hypothetical protein
MGWKDYRTIMIPEWIDELDDKGYREVSLKTPEFLEQQAKYHALWEKYNTEWDNWKPIRDIQ